MSSIAARFLFAALAAVLALGGCGRADARADAASAEGAIALTDDLEHEVRLAGPARRIVSLKPSVTQTLVAMGAADRLVGRTDWDTDAALRHLPSVGGTVTPNLEQLVALRPDLVLGWETTDAATRQRIEEMGIPVFATRSHDTTDVFRSFASLGRLTGRRRAADSLAASVRAELAAVAASVRGLPRPSVFFVVWNDPPMTAGPDTYIGQLVEIAGGRTAFPELRREFTQVSMEEIVRRQPQVLVLPQGEDSVLRAASLRRLPGWRELRALNGGATVELPADLISQAGPRLGESARRLRDAIHPDRAGR